ncbi:DNA polymerase III subunit delta [Pseudomonas saudimassiliensis]|uniref:DNA polymerase III subunit delta' n=1 Tax=Pseudomonas saudimassiliensis TaxID=1461581 RepID=A0A078ML36_9PSED|nr:DNA polymerase III subunit delta' [Pseudomonas saudimassiliensis]CEA05461.1 DNA polymerase III subunit delta [Pseudomonas saudimassiliensis]CEF27151.1 DNA polymerase III subunit delta [Pseudomonas saudimassiliensis]
MADAAARPCPWHMPAWEALTAGSRHAHAFLFAGLPGVGKRLFAEAFAAHLLCLQPVASHACGQCRSCLLQQAGSHPDRLVVEPEEQGKAIRIDAIRQLGDFIGQTAQQGGRKVIILHPAEAMNLNAANALLKSLEEPTPDTYLLLVSDQPSRLLPTIRSRCRVQPLITPGHAEALAWLQHSLPDLSPEQHAALLLMAGGAPLRAVALQAIDAASLREQVVEGVKALLKSQQSASQLAERWTSVPLELLADWFCDWTLDLLRLKTGAADVPVNADMDKVLPFMARHLQLPALLDWQSWLLQHRGMLLGKANLNRVLFIETLLIRWKQLLERR